MDNSSLVTLAHSPWEEDTACHARSHRGCTWKQSEPEGVVEIGFIITGWWDGGLFLSEGYDKFV